MPDHQFSRRALLGAAAIVAIALSARGSTATYEITRTPAQWRRRLGPDRYRILREAGTERAYTSSLLHEKRRGIYACAGCGLPLFSSKAKYDSGTGWPSFTAALPNAVTRRGTTFGMFGIEEVCRRCGGHLGHLFNDGPPPTGMRHCINGLALMFRLA